MPLLQKNKVCSNADMNAAAFCAHSAHTHTRTNTLQAHSHTHAGTHTAAALAGWFGARVFLFSLRASGFKNSQTLPHILPNTIILSFRVQPAGGSVLSCF